MSFNRKLFCENFENLSWVYAEDILEIEHSHSGRNSKPLTLPIGLGAVFRNSALIEYMNKFAWKWGQVHPRTEGWTNS